MSTRPGPTPASASVHPPEALACLGHPPLRRVQSDSFISGPGEGPWPEGPQTQAEQSGPQGAGAHLFQRTFSWPEGRDGHSRQGRRGLVQQGLARRGLAPSLTATLQKGNYGSGRGQPCLRPQTWHRGAGARIQDTHSLEGSAILCPAGWGQAGTTACCPLCRTQASEARSPAQGPQPRSVRYLAQHSRPPQGYKGSWRLQGPGRGPWAIPGKTV